MRVQQINLYHPIFRRQPKLFSAQTMLRAWLALLAVGLLVTGFDAWQTHDLSAALANARREKRATAARLAAANALFGLERERHALKALHKRVADLGELSRFLRQGRRAAVGPAAVLVAVSRGIVPGLWVSRFSLDRKTKALVLVGHSLHPSLVPLFLHRLVSQPTLSGYRFRSLTITRPRRGTRYRPYVDFTATTRPPPAHAAQPSRSQTS